MTPIQLINALINIICDPLWQIMLALLAGILAALVASLVSQKRPTVYWAGAISALAILVILLLLDYVLNLPLGPPLPALGADYLALWLAVGAVFGLGGILGLVLLGMGLRTLVEARIWLQAIYEELRKH